MLAQQAINLRRGLAHFFADGALGESCVASTDGFDHGAKIRKAFLLAIPRTLRMRQADTAPAPDAAVQQRNHRGKCLAFSAGEKHIVKTVLAFQYFLRVVGLIGFGDLLECAIQSIDERILGVFGEPARGQPFQNGANRIKILRFFKGEVANDRTLVGNDGDQALGLQLPQSFPDHRSGNAHHGDQFTLDQALPGMQAAGNDRLTKLVEDLAAKRSGSLSDGGDGSDSRGGS